MTASISEHLKKVEWPGPSAWKIAFHAIDGALAARLLTRRAPSAASRPRLLNLGCGPVRYPGWVNADFFTFAWVIRGYFPAPEWVMDATKPWKCPDNYWDGIFTEHVLEHPRAKNPANSPFLTISGLLPSLIMKVAKATEPMAAAMPVAISP